VRLDNQMWKKIGFGKVVNRYSIILWLSESIHLLQIIVVIESISIDYKFNIYRKLIEVIIETTNKYSHLI
jgi:hypothetical protein